MLTQVIDGLHQIVLPTPYKVGTVNCYVSLTEPVTLIDTGIKGAESRAALEAELAALDLRVSDLRRVIITHAHADHYGQAAEIVRASNAEVWTHRHNRVPLEAYETIRAERNAFYVQIMIEAGVPLEQRQRVVDGRRVGDPHAEAVQVDRVVDEGD